MNTTDRLRWWRYRWLVVYRHRAWRTLALILVSVVVVLLCVIVELLRYIALSA